VSNVFAFFTFVFGCDSAKNIEIDRDLRELQSQCSRLWLLAIDTRYIRQTHHTTRWSQNITDQASVLVPASSCPPY